MLFYGHLQSPIGTIQIVADDEFLQKISFVGSLVDEAQTLTNGLVEETKKQLSLYFSKEPHNFDLPLAQKKSSFQERVLNEVKKIPHGQTLTYTQLAYRIGSTKLSRAVAAANASNSFMIIIPCHRVIGKNNELTGYAGGLWRKQWLLEHENAITSLLP